MDSTTHFDILLIPGRIVTMNKNREVLTNSAVGIMGQDIVYVGPNDSSLSADEVVAQPDSILIPGMVNAHTHVPMTLMRGFADDMTLMQFLHDYTFPTEAKFANEDFVYWGSRLGVLESIQSGVTTFCDMFYYADQVGRAAQDGGIRALIGADIALPYLQDLTPSERMDKGLALHQQYYETFKKYDRVSYAIGPHSPYSTSPEFLTIIRQEAMDKNVPIVTHVAETQGEKAMIEQNFGVTIASPIQHLQSLDFFDAHVISVHTVCTSDKDLEVLHQHQVGVVHCPQSNLKLASGIARIPEMLEKGITVALGTDGPASNNDLVLWEEMPLTAMLHKGFRKDPTIVTAEQTFAMATIDGAKVLGMDDQIGSIEVGKKADLAWVDTRSFHQIPSSQNVYSQLVYSTKSSDVHHVWVDGQLRMKDQRVLDKQQEAICQYAVNKRKEIDAFLAAR